MEGSFEILRNGIVPKSQSKRKALEITLSLQDEDANG